MSSFWNVFLVFIWIFPWVMISVGALIAFLRRKSDRVLLLQLLGSVATLGLSIVDGCILWLLSLTHAPARVYGPATTICNFLIFVAVLVFAVGYCLEKMARRRKS